MPNIRIVACGSDNPVLGTNGFLEAAMDLTGKGKSLKILVVPTARSTAADHDQAIHWLTHESPARGLRVQVLHGFGKMPTVEQAQDMVAESDLLWVPGGDTRAAMLKLIAHGLADVIRKPVLNGQIVGAGASAGLNFWFDWAHSDAEAYVLGEDADWKYVMVQCLALFRGVGACPHFNRNHPRTHISRAADFIAQLCNLPHGTVDVGIGVPDTCALMVYNGHARALNSVLTSYISRFRVIDGVAIQPTTLHPSDGPVPLTGFLN